MRIIKVKLSNWCQHRDKEFEFIPGLNGIVGRNGSGKSNLVRAIPRGLMPGTASSIGIKEDDVSWGAENGKIIIIFEHCGTVYTLTRAVKGSSSSLQWGKTKSEKISGAASVDDKMRALLGIGSRVFNEIIFVAQEDLTGIIFQRPADRTKTFHSLLGLDNAEKIREIIGNKLSMMPADSCEDLIAQLRTKEAAAEKELAEVQAALANVSVLSNAERVKMQATVDGYAAWLREEARQASIKTELDLLAKEESSLLPKKAALRHRTEKLAVLLSETSDSYEDAGKRVKELEAAKQAGVTRQQAQRALDGAREALAACVVPAPFPESEFRALEAKSVELNRKLKEVSDLVKALTAGGATCPTCRKPILTSEIDEYRNEQARLQPLAKAAYNDFLAMNSEKVKYDVAIRDAHHKTSTAKATIAAAEQTLASLPAAAVDVSDLEDFKQIVATYEDLAREHAANQEKLVEADSRLSAIDVRRKALYVPATDVALVLQSDAEQCKQALAEDNVRQAQASKLDGQIEALLAQVNDHKASILELQNREAGLSKVRETRALMEEARGILHRDCLPAVAARAFLVSLNQSLARQLHEFDAEYAARINDDLSFDCLFDSNVISAKRLSGGQKVTLAIATQFALYDLLGENLGILVLDEPSVYLDTDHIDCLTNLLEKVKTRAAASGLQVIVVTHEDRLKRVFDKAIEL